MRTDLNVPGNANARWQICKGRCLPIPSSSSDFMIHFCFFEPFRTVLRSLAVRTKCWLR